MGLCASVVALHAVTAIIPAGCDDLLDQSCSGYSTHAMDAGNGVFVFLVVARGDPETGVAGISFSFDFSTLVDVDGFTLCADSQTGHQSGTVISWNPDTRCQRAEVGADGVHALAGVFHVVTVGPGFLAIHPNQEVDPPRLAVIGCDGTEVSASGSGMATFGSLEDEGINPCEAPVPTRHTTWSRLKALY